MSSREFRGRKVVLWPSNIDSTRTISQGRKIPLKEAVKSPTVSEIVKAAKELGLDPEIEEKSYPRLWWTERVRIAVNKIDSKRKTLELIARKIRELRGEGLKENK